MPFFALSGRYKPSDKPRLRLGLCSAFASRLKQKMDFIIHPYTCFTPIQFISKNIHCSTGIGVDWRFIHKAGVYYQLMTAVFTVPSRKVPYVPITGTYV